MLNLGSNRSAIRELFEYGKNLALKILTILVVCFMLLGAIGCQVHFFPDDTLTDQPERVMCAEIIREKALHNLPRPSRRRWRPCGPAPQPHIPRRSS